MVAAIGYDVQQISTGGQAGGRTRQKGNYYHIVYLFCTTYSLGNVLAGKINT